MDTIRGMYDHLFWANSRLLSQLLEAEPFVEEAAALFQHILQAEQIWLTRLRKRSSKSIPLWPAPDRASLSGLAERSRREWTAYLDELDERMLDERIEYGNQTGATYRTAVRDILIHLALHGQYHRGQVNTALKRAGVKPVNVDYIAYIRSLSG